MPAPALAREVIESDPPVTEAAPEPAGYRPRPGHRCGVCRHRDTLRPLNTGEWACEDCGEIDPASRPPAPERAPEPCQHRHIARTDGRDKWGAPCPSHLCLECGHLLAVAVPEPAPAPGVTYDPTPVPTLYGRTLPPMPPAPDPRAFYAQFGPTNFIKVDEAAR